MALFDPCKCFGQAIVEELRNVLIMLHIDGPAVVGEEQAIITQQRAGGYFHISMNQRVDGIIDDPVDERSTNINRYRVVGGMIRTTATCITAIVATTATAAVHLA